MNDVIGITTTKYSALFKRILLRYNYNVEIFINGVRYCDNDIPELLNGWCTNHLIRNTYQFELRQDGHALFGFHDSPEELWVAASERPFLEQLQGERIIRIDRPPMQPSGSQRATLVQKVVAWLYRLRQASDR